jgi:hypothetical protein
MNVQARMSTRVVVVTAAIVLVLFLLVGAMGGEQPTSDEPESPQMPGYTEPYTIPSVNHHWGTGS